MTLRPRIGWSGDRIPLQAEIDALHHRAHEDCFIANSIRAPVRIESV